MTLLYDLAYLTFALIYSPAFLMKIKQADSSSRLLKERSGMLPQDLREKFAGRQTIWIHAVSVGEVMAAQKFVEGLLERCPGCHLLLTTVTPTGQKIAKKLESENVTVCYFPFDLSFACRNFFKTFHPQCLLLMETEIWPNLLSEAAKAGVPTGILNARLSEKSARRYRRFAWIFRPLFQRLAFVLAQTPEDARRFCEAGMKEEAVSVLGNMKFDNVEIGQPVLQNADLLRKQWNVPMQHLVWIAGSTHPGEEEILLKTFSRLRQDFPALKMIIAPRHIERSEKIVNLVRSFNLQPVIASEVLRQAQDGEQSDGDFDVMVLNQLGILKDLYQIAELVFMGGSFVPHGGQNPIEPAAFKKVILHGRHVFNFEKIYQQLDQEGASLKVQDEQELYQAALKCLKEESLRRSQGERAFEVIRRLQGATSRHLDWILKGTHDVQIGSKLLPQTGGRV